MACNDRPPAHHIPESFPRIGVHTRCNLVTTWCATPRECVDLVLAQHRVPGILPRYYTRGLPCVLPASLLTGRISISDHALRVQMEALAVNAAATVCSPRPTADYRQAASGLLRCDGIRAPLNRPRTAASNETLLAAHSTQHTLHSTPQFEILSQGCVEARALSNDQATSYCNATPPRRHTHIRK